jgi:hypothetical protein
MPAVSAMARVNAFVVFGNLSLPCGITISSVQ